MDPARIESSSALGAAIHSFSVDRITAEVTAAFDEAGIESILLKGPAIATWLYANDVPRLYGDSDLLIPRGAWLRAQEVMRALGFHDKLGPLEHPRMEAGDGYPWARPGDEANVDLHFTLFGLAADPDAVWEALSRETSYERVGGAMVRMPSHAARLLHICLHAVQHGGETPEEPMGALERRPMVDLERAVALAPPSTWREARSLAERLQGMAAFVAGLTLLPEGAQLAGTIGVRGESSAAATLRLEGVPMSEGFAELSRAPGARSKIALVARELFPTPSFMRWWKPLAGRGRLGLALTYAWRLAWLAYRAVPGYLAWRRATRLETRGTEALDG